ncbi:MAG: glycoside hydrolase family 172 protein [Armatimonadota bacterium]
MKKVMFVLILLMILLSTSVISGGNELSRDTMLSNIYLAKDYEFDRVCSLHPAGPDGKEVMQPGEIREIANIEGPGIISHLWFTLSRQTDYVLKDCVLRIYWDDEENPSVECPIGEFFGLGHGKYYDVRSIPFETGNKRGYNCFFPMPFKKRCRITFENSPNHSLRRLFYHINYKKVEKLPDDALYFFAQYRQAKPTGGNENYVILEAEGRGHFVGLFYYNRTNSRGWWGDGGEHIEIDGRMIDATGQEDYFGQGWSFGVGENGHRFGSPLYESATKPELADNSFYRFHLEDPIPFKKTFRMTMRHGAVNERTDDYSTVAFWYQTLPFKKFPELPKAEDRYPSRPDNPQEEIKQENQTGIPQESIEY